MLAWLIKTGHHCSLNFFMKPSRSIQLSGTWFQSWFKCRDGGFKQLFHFIFFNVFPIHPLPIDMQRPSEHRSFGHQKPRAATPENVWGSAVVFWNVSQGDRCGAHQWNWVKFFPAWRCYEVVSTCHRPIGAASKIIQDFEVSVPDSHGDNHI